jgi:hypothetical protein
MGTQVMLFAALGTFLAFFGPTLFRRVLRGGPTSSGGAKDRSLGAYRTPSATDVDASPVTHRRESANDGEVRLPFVGTACAFCGKADYTSGNPIVSNEVCRPSLRVAKCPVTGTHVHRSCAVCKAAWLSMMPGEKK